jgi:NTP pyrophosphatase (non-canonical NTP hydrolase)
VAESVNELFGELVRIMARLRGENGCPWDREQTHQSIKPYFVEETYEVLEAIDEGDADKLCEELGDVMLQVVFHARMAEEAALFQIGDVLRAINEKLVRRHPHVFGTVQADTAQEVLFNWEQIKKTERQNAKGHASRANCRPCCGPTGSRKRPPASASTGRKSVTSSQRWRRSSGSFAPPWRASSPIGWKRSWATCSSRW